MTVEEEPGQSPWSKPRPSCGTENGYQWHLRHRKLPTCRPCRDAHNARMRARREMVITCRECGEEKRNYARGRCVTCYGRWHWREYER